MDASGEYYIAVDSEKCNGCGQCAEKCPQKALEIVATMVDIEERVLAAVKEEYRKKIRYTCAPCTPEKKTPPCVSTCAQKAINWIWKNNLEP
ncbi:4Fe-4S binding protein [Candidatus Bathyarchaeota archaeon]|nr:4Fe-4S binding protein [Candidatus Bathyarchaeota archaeon]